MDILTTDYLFNIFTKIVMDFMRYALKWMYLIFKRFTTLTILFILIFNRLYNMLTVKDNNIYLNTY